MANGTRPNPRAGSTTLLTVLIVVAVLYFAREVLIPLALATLLSFLLAPLVTRLRHWGLGRVASAMVVVVLFFAVLGVIGTIMATQLADLGHKLPSISKTSIRSWRPSALPAAATSSGPRQSFTT